MIVWRPLEHISTRSSRVVGATGKNVSGVACQATHELPFGAIGAVQWLATRPVKARVCMYPADQLLFSLR